MNAKEWLWEVWLKPILETKPEHLDDEEYLALVLNVHNRVISRYVTHRAFNIPGMYLVNGTIPTQGVGDEWRRIGRQKHLLARVDDATGVIDVEHQGHLFRLTSEEWAKVRRLCRLGKGQEDL
jgi:hypothetical protein